MKIKSFKRDYSRREKLALIAVGGILSSILLAGLVMWLCTIFTTTNKLIIGMGVIFLLVSVVVIVCLFIVSMVNLYKVAYSFFDPDILDTVGF